MRASSSICSSTRRQASRCQREALSVSQTPHTCRHDRIRGCAIESKPSTNGEGGTEPSCTLAVPCAAVCPAGDFPSGAVLRRSRLLRWRRRNPHTLHALRTWLELTVRQ